jgi:crotonobetainyl-CoA:carnitine CoA-transferase CaiB-like acyl-CoA transferase
MRFADAPQLTLEPSRAVGADSEAVFRDLLGIDHDRFEELAAAGAF